ncbi:hypothetical protein M569_17185 [Genlisea aurea]|uniref:Uncharacterized protein n=1 Tax=Genlisea aurea TaxID=192259 RepID=S8DE30_9LAMI|nr:hypothetical protein M569_17185 [Genlisea aurea]
MPPRRTARVSSQRFAAGEADGLIAKLQELLPDSSISSGGYRKAKILKEACDYIKKLHREVDDLSENISRRRIQQ